MKYWILHHNICKFVTSIRLNKYTRVTIFTWFSPSCDEHSHNKNWCSNEYYVKSDRNDDHWKTDATEFSRYLGGDTYGRHIWMCFALTVSVTVKCTPNVPSIVNCTVVDERKELLWTEGVTVLKQTHVLIHRLNKCTIVFFCKDSLSWNLMSRGFQ